MITPEVILCKRIAIRIHGKWQWYGPPIRHTLRGFSEEPKFYTASMVLESFCTELVKEYGLEFLKSDNAKIVEAPSEEAYERIDMGGL